MESSRSMPYERPTEYADRIGQEYVSSASKDLKKSLGQYLTPVEIADFMAGLSKSNIKEGIINILDPGAGAGILSCAICEHIAGTVKNLSKINLTAYEVDLDMAQCLKKSLEYTRLWLKERDIDLIYIIKTQDFVLANAGRANKMSNLSNMQKNTSEFDIAISNPPYFKIPKSDARAKAVSWVVSGQPNIYALFMVVSASLLKEGGELIFITPRSYASGPYFRLFREKFFSIVKPIYIHLFDSRKDTFEMEGILQENIILKAEKDKRMLTHEEPQRITLSSSNGIKSLRNSPKREVNLPEIIHLKSRAKLMGIPISHHEEIVARLVNSWEGRLKEYGYAISTGPVVPFRTEDHLVNKANETSKCVPLLWMQNVKPMSVQWPAFTKKPQAIEISNRSIALLVPNKNYVLLRRFSAKEDNRRLVAAPHIAHNLESKFIGLENHVNYIYKSKGELSLEEAYGLSAVYNCGLLDTYFRIFNGNTQVSATEIREMPLPPLETIKEIGRHIMKYPLSIEEMNHWVTNMLISSDIETQQEYDAYEQDTRSTGDSESAWIASCATK